MSYRTILCAASVADSTEGYEVIEYFDLLENDYSTVEESA
jgi:hypothetical protein